MERTNTLGWLYEAKTGDDEGNARLLRLLAWFMWFENDWTALRPLGRLYVRSGAATVVHRRSTEFVTALPPMADLLKVPKEQLDELVKTPILAGGLLPLVSKQARAKLFAPLPPETAAFERAVQALLVRVLPTATRGAEELAIMAALTINSSALEGAEQVIFGPVVGSILQGDVRREKKAAFRWFVPKLRGHLRLSFRKRMFVTVQKDAEAWVLLFRDHDGDPVAAWEAMKDKGWYDGRASMLEGIHPFSAAFGVHVHQGRRPDLIGPDLPGVRVAPTQRRPWTKRKVDGETSG